MATPHVVTRRLFAFGLALLLVAPVAALPQHAELITYASAPTPKAVVSSYAGTYALPGGGHLVVEADGNSLRITGHGQAAVEALTPSPRPAGAEAATYEAQMASILDGWKHGDLAPLFATFPKHRRERATRDLTHLVHLFTDAHGALEGYEILGTVPASNGRTYTFARLRFAEGTEVMRFVWRGGYLGAFNRNVFPTPTVAALPVAVGQFIAVGRLAEAPLWFTFGADARTVTVEAAGHAVTAVRR